MFPGSSPDMSRLLEQAAQLQQQVMDAQAELAAAEVEGSAGGGLVRATVTGTGELRSLAIDPSVVDPQDTETLADLVVAAVRDASENASRLAAKSMDPFAALAGDLDSPFGALGRPAADRGTDPPAGGPSV